MRNTESGARRRMLGGTGTGDEVPSRALSAPQSRQDEGGTAVTDMCRQLGVSEASFYLWKKKYGKHTV
jgi:hypothetical protein